MPAGLVNGTSIIEFATEEDLKQKILLPSRSHGRRVAIAGQGREAAMTRHRTWHRIEEIFGSCPSVQINCAVLSLDCSAANEAVTTKTMRKGESAVFCTLIKVV
jgi:hypothetical protein